MRKVVRWALLLLALALVGVGLCHGLRREDAPSAQGSAGLGLMLLEKEHGLYVLAVTENSPADRAGVLPGDYLISADGVLLTESAQLDGVIEAHGILRICLKRGSRQLDIELSAR